MLYLFTRISHLTLLSICFALKPGLLHRPGALITIWACDWKTCSLKKKSFLIAFGFSESDTQAATWQAAVHGLCRWQPAAQPSKAGQTSLLARNTCTRPQSRTKKKSGSLGKFPQDFPRKEDAPQPTKHYGQLLQPSKPKVKASLFLWVASGQEMERGREKDRI